jgi:hypothetical protein
MKGTARWIAIAAIAGIVIIFIFVVKTVKAVAVARGRVVQMH